MAQGYTQPVSGLSFLGFCSGKRFLRQEAKLCPCAQQTPCSCPVAVEMLCLQGYDLGHTERQRTLGQVHREGWESLKVI